jgi:hypothetical protein
VGSFGFSDRAFDNHVIHLSVVVYSLPFVVNAGVGASDDGKNCTMDEKVIGLLWRLTDL